MDLKALILAALCCLQILQPAVSGRIPLAQPSQIEYAPNTILVKPPPKKDTTFTAMSAESVNDDWIQLLKQQQGAEFDVQFVDTFNSGGWARYQHTKGDTDDIVKQLRAMGITCEKDAILHGYASPNDPDYSKVATAQDVIGLPDTWNQGPRGDKRIKVCVIDSGVQFDHPDLTNNIDQTASMNAITGENKPGAGVDDAGHGTHIAGIIGAVGNNKQGIVGVQWNADILVCKFMYGTPRGPQGTTSNAAKCIDWCRVNGAKITSNSYGSTVASSALQDAVSAAQAAGMIFVAAAGNDGRNIDQGSVVYPAGYTNDNIISVGNSNMDDGLGTLTNWGKISVDLFAPGTGIYSTWMGGGYKLMTGTSMATPFVAGAAALIWNDCPKLTAAQVRGIILQGVDPVTAFKDICTTGGRLNVDKSLQLAWNLDDSCGSRPKGFKPVSNAVATSTGAWGDWSNTGSSDSTSNAPAPVAAKSELKPTPPREEGNTVAQALNDGTAASVSVDAAQTSETGTRQTVAQKTDLPSKEYQTRRESKRETERAAREKAAREKAAREKAAREKAAREKAAREKAAREKAAKEAKDKNKGNAGRKLL